MVIKIHTMTNLVPSLFIYLYSFLVYFVDYFAIFFDKLFSDTKIGTLPENERIIVREPKYFQQLNSALVEDSEFSKKGLGNYKLKLFSYYDTIKLQN